MNANHFFRRHALRVFAVAAAVTLVSCAGSAPPTRTAVESSRASAAARPNIIVIVVDDMGYNDFSLVGGKIPTPNIDRLAQSGARMTAGYVTAAVCAPSRTAILTGRQQTRFGFEFNPVGRDETSGLSLAETTIAQTMKKAGYRTGMVGKWHIGQQPGYQPLDRGFDYFYGVLGGATPYLRSIGADDLHVVTAEDSRITRQRLPLFDGRTPIDPEGYVTDLFTDKSIGFIGDRGVGDRGVQEQQPFFLYLAHTAPHTPLQAPAKYLQRTGKGGSDFDRVYAGMFAALDDGVGRLIEHLKKTGQYDNTLVFFISDNGCPSYVGGACSNKPLNGWKGYPWDGGLRVPYLISWPARIKPQVRNEIVSSLDIAATSAALAGITHPRAEGVNLVSVLDRPQQANGRTLFWRTGPNHVVRQGRWKMIVANKAAAPAADDDLGRSLRPDGIAATVSPLGQWTLLYDLEKDPGEKVDVAAQNPQVVASLQRLFAEWDKDNVAPQWTSRRGITVEVNGARAELFN